jgi:hypothetical protein
MQTCCELVNCEPRGRGCCGTVLKLPQRAVHGQWMPMCGCHHHAVHIVQQAERAVANRANLNACVPGNAAAVRHDSSKSEMLEEERNKRLMAPRTSTQLEDTSNATPTACTGYYCAMLCLTPTCWYSKPLTDRMITAQSLPPAMHVASHTTRA